jgi:hypothetical protein
MAVYSRKMSRIQIKVTVTNLCCTVTEIYSHEIIDINATGCWNTVLFSSFIDVWHILACRPFWTYAFPALLSALTSTSWLLSTDLRGYQNSYPYAHSLCPYMSVLSDFSLNESRETDKYGYQSRGNHEWLCWRGLAAIYPTVALNTLRLSQLKKIRKIAFLSAINNLKTVLWSKFCIFFFCGVGLTSPGTAATSGLLYSPRW